MRLNKASEPGSMRLTIGTPFVSVPNGVPHQSATLR
jgi:hypothetical protein